MKPPAVRPSQSAWLGFLVLGAVEFLTVMDASVVNIALPVIRADLALTGAGVSWMISCYLIPFAGTLLLAGRLGDVVGHRRLFLLGTALFPLASAGCALAGESWQLLLGRAVQGLGAGLVVPAALALITALFPDDRQRTRALAIFAGMGGVAAPVGLVVGGLLAEIQWSWIFWVNVPLGMVVLLLARRVLPAPASSPVRLDVLGASAATGSVALLALAAGTLSDPAALPTALAALGALICTVALVWRQRTAPDPLVPRTLLAHRAITVGSGIFVLVGTLLLATSHIVTLYLQQVRGLSSSEATLVYFPLPLAMFAGTQLAPWLLARLPARDVLGLALTLQGLALALWTQLSTETASLLIALLVPAVPWAVGLGMSIVTSFVVCTSAIAAPDAGAASGMATSAFQGGGAVGLALVAALATAASDSPDGGMTAVLAGQHSALGVLAALAGIGAVLTRALPLQSDRRGSGRSPTASAVGR